MARGPYLLAETKLSCVNLRTDDYRIGIVSEPILGVSYGIVSATVVSADIGILADMSCITHDDQKAFKQPVTRPPCARAVLWSMIRERVGGEGGGRRL